MHQCRDRLRLLGPVEFGLQRGGHGPAALVAQHQHQRDLEVQPGVFQAAQAVGGEDVAGDADNEQVAEPLVEDQLGGRRASRCSRGPPRTAFVPSPVAGATPWSHGGGRTPPRRTACCRRRAAATPPWRPSETALPAPASGRRPGSRTTPPGPAQGPRRTSGDGGGKTCIRALRFLSFLSVVRCGTVRRPRHNRLFPFPQRLDYLSRSSSFSTLKSSIALCASSLRLDLPSWIVTLLILPVNLLSPSL